MMNMSSKKLPDDDLVYRCLTRPPALAEYPCAFSTYDPPLRQFALNGHLFADTPPTNEQHSLTRGRE